MSRAAAQAESKSQLFYAAVWLLTTAMLVVGVQTLGATEAFGDDVAEASSPASDFPLAGPDPTAATNPSTLYGGQMWSLVDSRIEVGEGLLGRAMVDVDVTVENTLGQTQLRVPDSLVRLVHSDGYVQPDGRFVDAGHRLIIEPGESVDVTIRFEFGHLQDPAIGDLAIEIGETNRIAATLALAGSQRPHPYPVFAAVDTDTQSLPDPDDARRQIVVEPSAATVDINAGPYRAAQGEQLAVVKVVVQRTEEAIEGAGYLDESYWAVVTDDGSFTPILVAPTARPATNADEVTLLFAFPEGSKEFQLVAGADSDTDSAKFSIVLPR